MFTARYALSPYIKQTRFVFKGLMSASAWLTALWILVKQSAGAREEVEHYHNGNHICTHVNVGGGLPWAAQLRWTSEPCSADSRVTLLWVRRGGMLPVGSVKSKEQCNGLGRCRAVITLCDCKGPGGVFFFWNIFCTQYIPLAVCFQASAAV
jgi:hypothetical protein